MNSIKSSHILLDGKSLYLDFDTSLLENQSRSGDDMNQGEKTG